MAARIFPKKSLHMFQALTSELAKAQDTSCACCNAYWAIVLKNTGPPASGRCHVCSWLCSEVKERMKKTKAEKASQKSAQPKGASRGATKVMPKGGPKGGKR